MKRNMSLIMVFLFGCTMAVKKMPEEYSKAKEYYSKEVKKEASYLMNCKKVKVKNANLMYLKKDSPIDEITTETSKIAIEHHKLKVSVPISFYVSGCNKRVKFLLVYPNRKQICNSGYEYKSRYCVPIQDSSFVSAGE